MFLKSWLNSVYTAGFDMHVETCMFKNCCVNGPLKVKWHNWGFLQAFKSADNRFNGATQWLNFILMYWKFKVNITAHSFKLFINTWNEIILNLSNLLSYSDSKDFWPFSSLLTFSAIISNRSETVHPVFSFEPPFVLAAIFTDFESGLGVLPSEERRLFKSVFFIECNTFTNSHTKDNSPGCLASLAFFFSLYNCG